MEGPCQRESVLTVYTLPDFSDCQQHCPKIRNGRLPPIRTLVELQTLHYELGAITPNIKDLPWLWLSASDRQEEGVWRDYYTGEQLKNYTKPWYTGHDAKYGNRRSCLILHTGLPADLSWIEMTCNQGAKPIGCPCQSKKEPIIILRGSCQHSIVDLLYRPRQMASNPNELMLLGLYTTRIQYNSSSSQWIMTDANSNITAVSNASKASYVLGKHKWTVTGDVVDCHKGQPYTTYFKLSGCGGKGFTCDDGQCVTI